TGNANPGAPTASVITTRNGSLVLGVGNDWDNAIGRNAGPNKTLVHQFLPTVRDSYWVQMESNAIVLSGTSVAINDTVPTGEQYNLSIVEILPAAGAGGSTYSISGMVSPASLGSGGQLTLSGAANAIVTADSS